MDSYDVTVVGLGFTGLATAVSAAQAGFRVLGLDTSPRRVNEIAAAVPGCGLTTTSERELHAVLRSGRLRVRHAGRGGASARVTVLCVPTPVGRDGSADLRPLVDAADQVATAIRPGDLVLIQSTCPPGSIRAEVAPRLAAGSGLAPGRDVALAYSPVRLDPGTTPSMGQRLPRVVGGLSAECTTAAVAFLRRLAAPGVPVSSIETAELAKGL